MKRRIGSNSKVYSVFWRYGGGLMLALIAVVGLGQSLRASLAEAHFGGLHHAVWTAFTEARLNEMGRTLRTSLAEERRDPDMALRFARLAHRKYPYSYHVAIYAASLAWNEHIAAGDAGDALQAEHYLDEVRHWTRIGLHRNPYPLQLRWLNTRLLEIDDSIEEAIEYWERHTEWHFWSAYNHAVLADLYTQAGRFEDAERTLRMLHRSPELHRAAATALKSARTSDGVD